MKIGVVFISTGGIKMARALRSFRRSEPSLPVHILFNTASAVFPRNEAESPSASLASPDVSIRLAASPAYINGSFNSAMSWMRELGFAAACMFHDDTVFSPLPENIHHVSDWFSRLDSDPSLRESSGLTFSFMEALVQSPSDPGCWHRSPDIWNQMDLESEPLWRTLLPGGVSPLYFGSPGHERGVQLSDWFVKYFATESTCPISRLGPSGQIVPINLWERFGGFGEHEGIYYDMEYPVQAALHGYPPVKVIPNTPHLHLHNQSTAFGDPATGLWGDDLGSFIRKYGREPGAILAEHGYYNYQRMAPGEMFPEPNLAYWLYGGAFSNVKSAS